MKDFFRDTLGWWPLFVIVAVVFCIYTAIKESQKNIYDYSEPDDIFQILQKFDSYNYRFKHIHKSLLGEQTTIIHAKFCDDYEPPFSAGETLIWLHYLDKGACWEIKDKEYGYKFLRDPFDDTVVLTSNCKKIVDRQVVCDPPNIGIF